MKNILNQVRWHRARTRVAAPPHERDEQPDRASLRHQAALVYLSRRALQPAPSTSLLGDVCRIAARVLNVDHVHVVELLPDTRTLIARAAAGWAPERLARWQMDVAPESRLGQVLRTGGVIVLDETTDVSCTPGGSDLLGEMRMQSGLAIGIAPIREARALFGVYSVRRRRFSRDDVQFVRAVAPIVESALLREAEMNIDRATRASNSASQADLLRLVVSRLRPALRQSVSHLWRFRTARPDTFTFRRAVKMTEKQVAEVADFIEDLSILADLLDLRLPRRDTVLVEPVLNSLVEQLNDRAVSGGILLELRAMDEFSATKGDPGLFRRAIYNLLDNALRCTGPGGRVTITVASPDASTVLIEIVDTGRGMTPAQVEQLSINRLGAPDSDDGGPGLGWRLTSAIVQAHGGTLTASSGGSGLGAAITVRVPRLTFRGV